jgi:hypothetical protein
LSLRYCPKVEPAVNEAWKAPPYPVAAVQLVKLLEVKVVPAAESSILTHPPFPELVPTLKVDALMAALTGLMSCRKPPFPWAAPEVTFTFTRFKVASVMYAKPPLVAEMGEVHVTPVMVAKVPAARAMAPP